MKLIRGLHNLKPFEQGCVATMGGFDGVHLGHQAILKTLKHQAEQAKLPATVITFEPLPREYFRPEQSPPKLTRLPEKLRLFAQHGVDRVLCLYFNKALSEQSAEQFIKEVLVNQLGVRYLLVGEGFRFGYQRSGDFELLSKMGNTFGFKTKSLSPLLALKQRISSTRIRECLSNGDMDQASTLLGRPYFISGRVAKGDARGRTIGFPTANIHLKRRAAPLNGVFAVQINIDTDPNVYMGVANIGMRPTFNVKKCLLEAHIFDFNQEIYGHHLQAQFLHKIRDEQRFDSIEQLKTQIALDAEQAKAFFAKR